MKPKLKVAVFIALCSVYLWNEYSSVSPLKTPAQPSLQSPPPSDVSRTGQLHHQKERSPVLDLPVYSKELAVQAIRPSPWTCGDPRDSAVDKLTAQKPMFAFVHIYKTAGSSMRHFFEVYSYICRKGWMCLIGCTGVKSSSIQSKHGADEGVLNWNKCKVIKSLDRDRRVENRGMTKRRLYPTVNNTILRSKFDIYGGHFRIGTGDYILKNNPHNVRPVRHVAFLRDPINRYISGVLYQTIKKKPKWTSKDFADLVKERVQGARAAGHYWDKSLAYLLTPSQLESFDMMKSNYTKTETRDQFAEMKAMAAINNLMKYNVIIGMTERMKQSIDILKHVLLANANKHQKLQFEKHTNQTRNVSKKGDVSTTSVLDELKEDAEFMAIFEEYVKYEKLINDYAMGMHLMQHEALMKQRTDS